MEQARTQAGEDVIDVRDLIARFEEIEESTDEDEVSEAKTLRALLDDLEGNGGDEEWRGSWYPLLLIAEHNMQAYAQETAEECGMIPEGGAWPTYCIDWEWATREFKMDYTTTEYEGVTYYYR